MKSNLNTLISITFASALAATAVTASAQTVSANASGGGHAPIDKSIEYHGGRIIWGTPDAYFIWYGCWGSTGCGAPALTRYNDAATMQILSDFASTLGSTSYFYMNALYPDASGQAPSGALVYGGSIVDAYSRGSTLTEADIAAIVREQLDTGALPMDPFGIYVVLTSADVTVEDGATQFCLTCCNLHGHANYGGYFDFPYVFVGNPSRCPGTCGANPNGEQTPNGNFAADLMVSWLAHALNALVTDPFNDAWFDRYGLENSEKCEGTYGTTYAVTNPDGQTAQANVKLGERHFLLQQNWVNVKKGHCAMNLAQ